MHTPHPNSTYKPLELSAELVYELAKHGFGVMEIAEMFNIERATLMAHYGTDYKSGKMDWSMKPRKFLRRIIDAFDDLEDEALVEKSIPVERALKAADTLIKLQVGKELADAVKAGGYDTVEDAVQILTRPDQE